MTAVNAIKELGTSTVTAVTKITGWTRTKVEKTLKTAGGALAMGYIARGFLMGEWTNIPSPKVLLVVAIVGVTAAVLDRE